MFILCGACGKDVEPVGPSNELCILGGNQARDGTKAMALCFPPVYEQGWQIIVFLLISS